MAPTLDARFKNRKVESPKVRPERQKSPLDNTVPSVEEDDGDSPGTYMPIPMIVRYGANKEMYVNPNAGFASVMDYVREKLSASSIIDVAPSSPKAEKRGQTPMPFDREPSVIRSTAKKTARRSREKSRGNK
ncbi:hypothetical protein RvY_15777 [Ramazzottius varieornatus]|uniref:Uncharacterized protein n=1 Tax=Ramazzottius varieornatus TaxID=947166 RepID=A0A1D1W2U1_RAMVA|nr:hypothetical protein RvY_15777 [Ramazzottius varieornatus]